MAELINKDCLNELLINKLNIDIKNAARPIIAKALCDIEMEMREKLGSLVIAIIDESFSVERNGRDLRILVKYKKSGK